jgi:hypothetical protein
MRGTWALLFRSCDGVGTHEASASRAVGLDIGNNLTLGTAGIRDQGIGRSYGRGSDRESRDPIDWGADHDDLSLSRRVLD